MHLIDLSRWYMGDFPERPGADCHLFLGHAGGGQRLPAAYRRRQGQTAQLHATWTEWKNLFSLEIYGKYGKIDISGLGTELRGGEADLLPDGSRTLLPPSKVEFEYPGEDGSWELEFAAFLTDIREGRDPAPGVRDAQAALRIVEAIYKEHGR
jgi:predicted dehydrogenase